ncbi:T9SS type A sorting domain-containing protein [Hymenobacter sp. HMF4947]|uniref:T9SS type A sorting domain-containing protein n=1 Tax=Hymenobacter ginkgonis TaxID=2682976 RepID=A0A7K1TCC0_9BACT|nr:CotH kinase family protein [Hymenobacter ginkgonis]MVN76054.1 T9SS type A sorting domain-containing protein [Hymenobacter ginkgonis]
MKHLLFTLLLSLPLSSWAQVVPLPGLGFLSSDLPIIVIDTHQKEILDDPKIEADMGIIDNGPGKRNLATDSFNNYTGKIGIETRGSSSQWYFPKKSFGVETRDAAGEDLDASLLGMPAGSDWVLSASYGDKTLMRNVLTYQISNQVGNYASRTRFCEVVINNVYQGVYILAEKVKRGADRVNISKLKTTDTKGDALTGGYIVKLDKATGSSAANWTSKFKNPTNALENEILFQVEYPKLEDINLAQRSYIQAYVDSFETALSGGNFNDARRGYRHFINTTSFADYFLLTELSRNIDGYCFSTYFYKDRTSKNGKLTMGPAWDYDLAWGSAALCAGSDPAGWVYSNASCGHQIPFWWRQLLADPAFVRELRARWDVLRSSVLNQANLDQLIDANAAQVAESQGRNFTAWPILGVGVWANAVAFPTYGEEVNYLKNWMHQRLAWMDNNIPTNSNPLLATKAPVVFAEATASPVPFGAALAVAYSLPSASVVRVALADALGRPVYQQALPRQSVGEHVVHLTDCAKLAPGVYFLQLTSDAGSRTLRVVHTE